MQANISEDHNTTKLLLTIHDLCDEGPFRRTCDFVKFGNVRSFGA